MAHHHEASRTGGPRSFWPRRASCPAASYYPAVTAIPLDASVIVPSHRGAHRLPALLEALSRQDHLGPWEVVVVLDGVLDDSPRILEQWSDRLTLRVLSH